MLWTECTNALSVSLVTNLSSSRLGCGQMALLWKEPHGEMGGIDAYWNALGARREPGRSELWSVNSERETISHGKPLPEEVLKPL